MAVTGREAVSEKLRMFCRGRRVVVACIGSPLRRDDAAGLYVCSVLRPRCPGAVIECPYGLENCVGELMRLRGTSLVIVDAVLYPAPPGTLIYADLDEAARYTVLSSHNLPVHLVIDILRREGAVEEAVVAGIVPGDTGVGEGLTSPVREAAEKLASILAEACCGTVDK